MKAEKLELPPKTYNLLQSWGHEKVPETFDQALYTALKESENAPKDSSKHRGRVPDDRGSGTLLNHPPLVLSGNAGSTAWRRPL